MAENVATTTAYSFIISINGATCTIIITIVPKEIVYYYYRTTSKHGQR